MPLVATDAIVLHAMDYLESSRILRLATRDAGVQAVIAKGVRRPKARLAAGLDLFAEGAAQLSLKPGRELNTLTAFDVTRVRVALAGDLARFSAAAAIAELVLRFGHDDAQPEVFDELARALDAIGAAPGEDARPLALGGAWRLVAAFGFAPALDQCARCHAEVPAGAPAAFSRADGGILCEGCARLAPGTRQLPGAARAAIGDWLAGRDAAPMDDAMLRAHQRLLREFVHEHLTDGRPLKAWDAWEKAAWAAGTAR